MKATIWSPNEHLDHDDMDELVCNKCEGSLRVITPATHTSEEEYGVRINPKSGHYIAWNSDDSWSADETLAMLECVECGHLMDVQEPIHWEFIF